jgi:hypothetical protein
MRLDDTRLTLLDRHRVLRRNMGVATAENSLYPIFQPTTPISRMGKMTINARMNSTIVITVLNRFMTYC